MYGPLGQQQAAHTASAAQWVVPGRDLSVGDGWVIELPGFVVNILSPAAAGKVNTSEAAELTIRANVMMMCGCPIKPGGLWNADDYDVGMTVRRGGEVVAEGNLTYAGRASHFAGELPVTDAGVFTVTVYAYDPETGNTGVDYTTVVITNR